MNQLPFTSEIYVYSLKIGLPPLFKLWLVINQQLGNYIEQLIKFIQILNYIYYLKYVK